MIEVFAAVRAIHFASLMAIFGAGTYLVLLRRHLRIEMPARAARILFAWAATLALVSAVAWLFLVAGQMSGDWRAALDPVAIRLVASGTAFGRIAVWRIAGLSVLWLLLLFRGPSPSLIVAIVAALLLGALGLTSHAAASSGDFGLVRAANDAVHLLAAGFLAGRAARAGSAAVAASPGADKPARSLPSFLRLGNLCGRASGLERHQQRGIDPAGPVHIVAQRLYRCSGDQDHAGFDDDCAGGDQPHATRTRSRRRRKQGHALSRAQRGGGDLAGRPYRRPRWISRPHATQMTTGGQISGNLIGARTCIASDRPACVGSAPSPCRREGRLLPAHRIRAALKKLYDVTRATDARAFNGISVMRAHERKVISHADTRRANSIISTPRPFRCIDTSNHNKLRVKRG